ncbi:hypothetical protein HGRIS_012176 [Hohenbuehelia grisea]|uniref:Uncharacterized protein n=1 Tax=Hohenbuehelia grisea TaxID=104357 RepID=A0ABR3IRF4_9AGAR
MDHFAVEPFDYHPVLPPQLPCAPLDTHPVASTVVPVNVPVRRTVTEPVQPLLPDFPTSPFETGKSDTEMVSFECRTRVFVASFKDDRVSVRQEPIRPATLRFSALSNESSQKPAPAHGSSHCLRPLPAEMWSEIIADCVASSHQKDMESSWTTPVNCVVFSEGSDATMKDLEAVMAVNSTWKQLALATSQVLPFPEIGVDPELYTKSTQCNLTVVLAAGPRGTDQRVHIHPQAGEFLSHIWSRTTSWRVEKMIDLNDPDTFTACFDHEAPLLRSMTITGARRRGVNDDHNDTIHPDDISGPQILPATFLRGHTPKLTHLILRNCLVNSHSTLLDGVTHLRLQWPGTMHERNERSFLATLRKAAAVEYLDLLCLEDIPPSWMDAPPQPLDEIELLKLKQLRITDKSHLPFLRAFLARLVAPSTLEVDVIFRPISPIMNVEPYGVAVKMEVARWKGRMLAQGL